MLKVTNLELNASTAKVIAQRVMEDRGMRVATRFGSCRIPLCCRY